jgi:nuclear transport factor 2 (NTF2) superfamily protein
VTDTPFDPAARAWVKAWEMGWARHDPDVIAARYAEDCLIRTQPFRALERGREAIRAFAERAFAEERSARFVFGEPLVGQDGRAMVEYRAVVAATAGGDVTLHGVSVLRFGPDGLVVEHRDCWTEHEGDHGSELVQEASR